MLSYYNIITLTALGFFDYKMLKIPNEILLGWLATIFVDYSISSTPITVSMIIVAIITAGIYWPIRQAVECSAGDFKLYAVLMLTDRPLNILSICLISMLISLIPMVSGIKKVPIALTTLLGYITFLLFV